MTVPNMISQNVFASTLTSRNIFDIQRPLDTNLNIKPLFGIRIPSELHEGPCRANDPTTWNKAKAVNQAKQLYDEWYQNLSTALKTNVKILDPVYVQFSGDHRIDKETWNKIKTQDNETDLYVLSHYRIPGLEKHTDKPVAIVGNSCATLDVNAFLNSQGKTTFGAFDYDQLEDIITSLKVKKALQQTKLLIVSNGKWDFEFNTVRSNIDVNKLKDKFGISSQYITIDEMMKEFEQVNQDGKYKEEAEKITKNLMQNAEKNTMNIESIEPSIMYYLTAKKLMQQYGCNGFTATCQEFCVSKFPMEFKVTPCITHTLLKDEGYVSACEADVNVFFSMALQMYLSNRAPYMGNTLIQDAGENLLKIHHDVPSRKMMGYDSENLPYRLVSFTERNWGPTMRYDFSRDKDKVVTFCRMTPNADKILVVKGKIEDVGGLNQWGCSLYVVIKVTDAMKYFDRAQQTGHHFSMVYGDYISEMERLAEVLNIKIEVLT